MKAIKIVGVIIFRSQRTQRLHSIKKAEVMTSWRVALSDFAKAMVRKVRESWASIKDSRVINRVPSKRAEIAHGERVR